MLVIGVLEMAVMFPTYLKYQQKIEAKISSYKSNEKNFLVKYLSELNEA
tara:strand:- start:137153 stop:137299 length:147 start_codon:yes stop_codon:yes gene_type:complete